MIKKFKYNGNDISLLVFFYRVGADSNYRSVWLHVAFNIKRETWRVYSKIIARDNINVQKAYRTSYNYPSK